MKIFLPLILIPFFTLCKTPENTSGVTGWRTGNNTGDHPDAWFNDESKTITVCLNVESSVKVKPSELESNFQEAFSDWHKYLIDRGYVVTPGNPYFKGFAYVLKFTCQNADLNILFGVDLPQNSPLIGRFPVNSSGKIAGIALYHDQSDPDYRVGTIWVAPQNAVIKTPKNNRMVLDWDLDLLRKTVIKHEVGHVFGVPHIPETIMSENILDSISQAIKTQTVGYDQLPDNDRFAPEMIHQIDHTFEILAPNIGATKEYAGFLGDRNGLDLNSYISQTLHLKKPQLSRVKGFHKILASMSVTKNSQKESTFQIKFLFEGKKALLCSSKVANAKDLESILGKSFLLENPLDPDTYLGFDSFSGQYRMKCTSGLFKDSFIQARYNSGNISTYGIMLETPSGGFEPLFSTQSPRFFHKN